LSHLGPLHFHLNKSYIIWFTVSIKQMLKFYLFFESKISMILFFFVFFHSFIWGGGRVSFLTHLTQRGQVSYCHHLSSSSVVRCSIFSNSGHIGWCTASLDTILKLDTLVMIQTKFGFNWSSSFRGEDFWKSLRRKSFSRRLQGLFRVVVFLILNDTFLPFSIRFLLVWLRLPV
jgi:hypothetical protein